MKTLKSLALVAALAVTVLGAGLSKAQAAYTFNVTNNTGTKITKLLASEDGTNYGFFDIGSGVAPGATVSLQWDKSTDESNCKWEFKAVYADGSESAPAPIDFCEDDLNLEFDE